MTEKTSALLQIVAENNSKVHAAGVEVGKKAEHDAFWLTYVNTRTDDFDYMFAGPRWINSLFNPPAVTLKPRRAMYMFARSGISGDFAQICNDLGFVIDFSNCVYINHIFNNSLFVRIGELNFSGAISDATAVFINANKLVTIDKIIVSSNTKYYTNWFSGCTALKNLTIEGVIDKEINFQQSPLTPESMISIITHLKDFSGTAEAYTKPVYFSDTCWAALEAHSTSPTGTTWEDYVTSLGWNT